MMAWLLEQLVGAICLLVPPAKEWYIIFFLKKDFSVSLPAWFDYKLTNLVRLQAVYCQYRPPQRIIFAMGREDFLACWYTFHDISAFLLVVGVLLLAFLTIIIIIDGVNNLESNIFNYVKPLTLCLPLNRAHNRTIINLFSM